MIWNSGTILPRGVLRFRVELVRSQSEIPELYRHRRSKVNEMKKNGIATIAAMAMILVANSVQAGFNLIAPAAAPGANITGALTGFDTEGSEMDGMQVTVYWAAGGSQTLGWADIDASSGGVSAPGAWSLSQVGDTFGNPWLFEALVPVSRLVINAIPGKTVFDIVDNVEFTAGSALGQAISSVMGIDDYDVVAQYSNAVSLNGVFHGDLYGMLDITFNRGFSGRMTFVADTDSADANSVIIPDAVPEPGSVILWSLCAVGAVFGRRRLMNVA